MTVAAQAPIDTPVKTLVKGRYTASCAQGDNDIAAAQHLRALCFGLSDTVDSDAYDARSIHILITETATGTLVCCYRLHALHGPTIAQSYAAQFYDLSALHSHTAPMMELGRFCVHPAWRDPDILRLAWAALTGFVDAREIKMLFGCTSFTGVDGGAYHDAFALLKARHLAPDHHMPKVKAPDVYRFAAQITQDPDVRKAMQEMPPLLRTYLLMGGWVSDHAVRDVAMNTLHVFTGLEIGAIPASRKRLLRALV